jgi:hypothetical protein
MQRPSPLVAWGISANLRRTFGPVNAWCTDYDSSYVRVLSSGIMWSMGGALRALIVVLALALLSPAAADARRHSGVSGRVTVDGPCKLPGPRCDTLGVAATIRVERASTRRLVRSVHAADGHFRIRLRPGRYRLLATADGRSGSGSAIVRVKRHRFTSVVIRLHRQIP